MANPESKFVITAEDRATATLKRVSTEFGGLGRAALSAASTLTAFGGALSLGALVAQVKSVADLQDRFGKLAQQTGIGVQSLTELDYAAKLSDVSTEDLSTGVTRLTSKMGDVAQGSKEAAAVFDSLGVKVKNNDGTLRSSEEVLKDIAQRFSEFADGSTKTAYAVELFGRSGAKLIPLLNSGRDGLAEMADEARALGVVFDEKAAKSAERFNDNLTRLGQAAQGLKIELLQGLIPPLYEITQRFIEARAAGIDFIDSLDIAANIKGFGTLDEKIADVQLKAVEKQVNASSAFWSEASEIRDFDGAKAIWPKGGALAKESAEKLYNTNQELLGITLKTNEALGNLIKGSFEATNETVTKQVNAVKKAASGK